MTMVTVVKFQPVADAGQEDGNQYHYRINQQAFYNIALKHGLDENYLLTSLHIR